VVISAFQLGGDISAELETYNENGSPVGVSMHNGTSATWTSYDYLKNLQGDILGICSVSGGIVTIYAAYVNETDELTHIFVDGEEIIATPSHPFYCPAKGWTDASHLRAGDILVLVNGEYVVVEKVQHELLERPVKVYNFQVEDYHTYYVASGVLVHNSCHHNSAWNTERRRYWRETAKKVTVGQNYGAYEATKENIDRMLRGSAPIGWDGASVELHHWLGVANDFFNYSPVSRTLHHFIHYLK